LPQPREERSWGSLNIDSGSMWARRLIDRMIEQEMGGASVLQAAE